MKPSNIEEAAVKMFQLTSRVHTLQEIVDLGEDLLCTPVAFSNSAFHHRARSRSYPQFDLDQRAQWLQEHRPEVYYEEVIMAMERATDSTPYICAAEKTVPRYFCKGFLNGKHVGHVTVPQVDIPLSEINTDVIRLICDACSKTYALESVSYAFDNYFLPEISIVEALYHGEFETESEFLLYASQYTFAQYHGFRGAYITGKGISGIDFKQALSNACTVTGIKQWLFASDNALIMLLAAATPEKLKDDCLCSAIQDTLNRFEVVAGVSDIFLDLWQLRRYMDYAKRIALFPDERSLQSHMLIQDEWKMALFFHDVNKALPDSQAYCATILTDILKYDQENSTEYAQTLRQYLLCGMSPTQTTQKMYLHKNTVLYRVRRLEELFGLHLSDMQLVYKLLISFSLLDQQPDTPA